MNLTEYSFHFFLAKWDSSMIYVKQLGLHTTSGDNRPLFIDLAYQGKDIVFRFIIEYSSLRDFCL